MDRIELKIVALANTEGQNNYAVILEEVDGVRRLPIVIGSFEAQAIAVALEGMQPARPLTHDLLKNTLGALNIQLEEVFISELIDGVFHASLLLNDGSGNSKNVDSRSSDAIAMAIRYGCPIYTTEAIMDEAGMVFENEASSTPKRPAKKKKKELSDYSVDELEKMLQEVLEKEDFETAAKIRDMINSKKQ